MHAPLPAKLPSGQVWNVEVELATRLGPTTHAAALVVEMARPDAHDVQRVAEQAVQPARPLAQAVQRVAEHAVQPGRQARQSPLGLSAKPGAQTEHRVGLADDGVDDGASAQPALQLHDPLPLPQTPFMQPHAAGVVTLAAALRQRPVPVMPASQVEPDAHEQVVHDAPKRPDAH